MGTYRRGGVGVLAVVSAVAVVTGCSSGDGETSPARPAAVVTTSATTPLVTGGRSSSAPLPPTLPAAAVSTPPAGVVDEDTGETIGARKAPSWDAASRASALAAAETVMRAFARPRKGTADAWWARLEPLLTPDAAQDYAWVDPANVPVGVVRDGARIVDATSAAVARVEVPTDVGPYTVILSRTDADSAWLASRITPPGQG